MDIDAKKMTGSSTQDYVLAEGRTEATDFSSMPRQKLGHKCKRTTHSLKEKYFIKEYWNFIGLIVFVFQAVEDAAICAEPR